MAIIQGPTRSFKLELLTGVHDFSTDVFKLALYTADAQLDPLTTAYSATAEVAAGGSYAAGGVALTPAVAELDGTATVDFADLALTGVVFPTVRGGLIYNSSKSDKAVYVLNFGMDRVPAGGVLNITFPAPDAASAILRIA